MRFVIDFLGAEVLDIKINHVEVDTTTGAQLGFAKLDSLGGEA